ncbi:MAG: Activator of (R)-2-hydroxyglutaryl-CoA dehydratase [uncultured Sulfurovum sp.]|uniref:Activator of (R)-2-hydroxyglutaryl-CoA dehydratase n=1 Tax=uncultured Sulfurovum sp. TaxID=269237 RepID=A0A6S6TAV1_9BACT|nr:MAG: Activator of (R)-2-hydroxyglutaryl-CoA dehydratase [uncultured Sulfurovum sp.]
MSAACSTVKMSDKNGDLSFIGQTATQWHDAPKETITYVPKSETIMLVGGLTILQDKLIESALASIGENFVALPNPNFESFQTGKAFGNRGQCNPTYFTVGNLVNYLQKLRDEQGLSEKEIVSKYVFLTAGGCGPCRFGMYITEYKKALRDAGFDGFRITSFEHDKGIFQGDDEMEQILNLSPKFFVTLVKAIIIGDIINLLGYKMRPYEVKTGSVDKAMESCRLLISKAFEEKRNLTKTLWNCRKILANVKLNRLQPKAKVLVMGEFWAAMTEGDGNYNLHRFLESEGAECIPQPVMNRLMLSIWEAERKLLKKETLEVETDKKVDFSTVKSRVLIKLAKVAVKTHFGIYAKAIGLHDYEIPNMEKLAALSEEYYTLDCEGGEGHLEVAHLIESVKDNLSHLTISVKPFGCMPSSAVSDGVQSLVTNRFPSANFLSVETSGEGAANFYSRVQMALFKAKQSAKEEFEALTIPEEIPQKVHNYLYQPHNAKAGSAAKLVESLGV